MFWESAMKWTQVIPGNNEPILSAGPSSHWDSWDADVRNTGMGNVLLPLHHSEKRGQSPLLPPALVPSTQPPSENAEQYGLQLNRLNQNDFDAKLKHCLPWWGVHQALLPHFSWQEVRLMYHFFCWPHIGPLYSIPSIQLSKSALIPPREMHFVDRLGSPGRPAAKSHLYHLGLLWMQVTETKLK